MKKFALYTFLVISCFIMVSCSNEEPIPTEAEIVPELTFEVGSPAYFDPIFVIDENQNEIIVKFTSNVPWSASTNTTDWCAVTPKNGEAGPAAIRITVKKNETYSNRSAMIKLEYGESTKTISINQKQLDALTLSADRFELPADGGDFKIEVRSNIDYKIKIADTCKEWLHQKTSSTTRALVTNSLTFTVDKSLEYNDREGIIEISSENKTEVITISQKGEGVLTVDRKTFSIGSNGQDISIEINSNFEYAIELPDVDWVEVKGTTTKSEFVHNMQLHVKANDTYSSRNTSLRFYDTNSDLSVQVNISQKQNNALIVEQNEYDFDENGGTFTIMINSNVDYEVKIGNDWIEEMTTPSTRALVAKSHTFRVSSMTGTSDRDTKISFVDKSTGIKEEVTVHQRNTFFIDNDNLELAVNENKKINLTNKTGLSPIWNSSDNSIVTVDTNGNIKAISRGDAIIYISTPDDKHKCECKIRVKDITDYISVYCGGGSMISSNDLILSGSSLNWYFNNKSNDAVLLLSLQLVDGVTGTVGNEMSVNATVNPHESVGYSTRIGMAGIHLPVTCRYKYKHNGMTYTTEAVYDGKW